MCYSCIRSGRCREIVKPGTCAVYGYVNGVETEQCARCGTVFPLPPSIVHYEVPKKEIQPT